MKTVKTRWGEEISGLHCEIVNWKSNGMEKSIWNYYIYIPKKAIPKTFKKFILKPRKFQFGKSSTIRYRYDYYPFEDYFDFHGGITFWEYIRNEVGEIVSLQVGCDFNHLCDEGMEYRYEEIKRDLECSVRKFISCVPELKEK